VNAAMMMMSDAEPFPVILTPKLFPVISPMVVPTEKLVGPCPMMRTVLGQTLTSAGADIEIIATIGQSRHRHQQQRHSKEL